MIMINNTAPIKMYSQLLLLVFAFTSTSDLFKSRACFNLIVKSLVNVYFLTCLLAVAVTFIFSV